MSEQPWFRHISTDTILEIHRESVERFGGDKSPGSPLECVERSAGAAWTAELYNEEEGSTPGLCFAGCLLFYLLKNHCFIDGNKRVAWTSCLEVLRSFDLTVEATDDEAEEFCLGILSEASAVTGAVEVAAWLAPRLRELPD